MYARAVPTAHGRARVRTGAFSNYRAGGIVRGRLATAQAARAGVPLVIVGAVFYHEKLTFKRLLGVVLCIMGIIMISDILPF